MEHLVAEEADEQIFHQLAEADFAGLTFDSSEHFFELDLCQSDLHEKRKG